MKPAVWADCPAELVALLEASRTIRPMRRRQWLFRAGQDVEGLYVLLEGAIVISRRDADGGDFALNLVMPGGTLGFRSWIDGVHHKVSARCSMASTVCVISRPVAAQALEVSREFEGIFFADLADELKIAQDRMLRIASLGVRDRMLLLLGSLMDQYGEPPQNGSMRILIPVNRRDMGALAGMTPETVSRCLRLLEDEALIQFTRTHAIIPCLDTFLFELSALGFSKDQKRCKRI